MTQKQGYMMKKIGGFLALMLIFLATACNTSNVTPAALVEPTTPRITALQAPQTVLVSAPTCVYPAGWREYRPGAGETAEALSARYGIGLEQLLLGNCLSSAAEVVEGRQIYLPIYTYAAQVGTVLPLGISSFSVHPPLALPGGMVKLVWQAQGAASVARVGWLYAGGFIEEVGGLPPSGEIDLLVPDDGRNFMSFMVLVRDDLGAEVSALASVRVACKESWFFAPMPADCPSAPLVTTFHEQHFEQGTIVYVPALGLHYVLVAGQEAVTMQDEFVPGMPPRQAHLAIPDGYQAPSGAIFYIWQHEPVRNALGQAISPLKKYPGMMQRSGGLTYLSAGSGHVYRLGDGLVWGVVIPQ